MALVEAYFREAPIRRSRSMTSWKRVALVSASAGAGFAIVLSLVPPFSGGVPTQAMGQERNRSKI